MRSAILRGHEVRAVNWGIDFDGARGPRVEEPLTWAKTYPIQWREPRVDLAELARLRWIEGFTRKQLAERYGRTEMAVQNYFQALRDRKSVV